MISPRQDGKHHLCMIIYDYFYFDNDLLQCNLLDEASPLEHIFTDSLMDRIDTFQLWLSDRPATTIILVGHCQFFFKLLPLSFRLRNSDVYEFLFTKSNAVDGSVRFTWTEGLLRFRSSLSSEHPWETLIKLLSVIQNSDNTSNNTQFVSASVEGVDEKACRICQVIILMYCCQ